MGLKVIPTAGRYLYGVFDALPEVRKFLFLSLIALGILQGAQAQSTPSSWQAQVTFYEIFVRSFMDSDGDGIGDFQGIISQLDYLNDGDSTTTDDLGIGGIWLMPVNPSPSYHGYDVTDYFGVNPDYGTMADFEALLDACHDRGIRVILDFVGNHSSSQHPHFLQSASGPGNPFRDWYVWSDQNPGSGWHNGGTGWYYGLFWSGMPDWNIQHPAVVDLHYDIIDHWLALGVDGFRYDAVKHLVNEGATYENHPGTFTYLEAFRNHYLSVNPEAICVGEAWSSSEVIAQYGPPHLDMCFEFELASAVVASVDGGNSSAFSTALGTVLDVHQTGAYAPFLTNHDQDRVMSMLGGDVDKARLAAGVLLTLPGTPFIYYGEEIGMTGSGSHPAVRTPMQWAPGGQAGFTSGVPWSAPQPDVDAVNVAGQLDDAESLLSTYREFIHLRNAHPALQRGETSIWSTTVPGVAAAMRSLGDERILVVHNFGSTVSTGVQVEPVGWCPGTFGVSDLRTGQVFDAAFIAPGTGWTLPSALPARSTTVYLLEGMAAVEDCEVPLTLRVDAHPLAPTTEVVHVRYRVNGGAEQVQAMDPEGAPDWWDLTVWVPGGAEVRWRYQLGPDSSGVETVPGPCGSDDGVGYIERFLSVGSAPASAVRVCFSSCGDCIHPPQQVILRVDLGEAAPHPAGVHIAGSFQGWDPAATAMVAEGDGIYAHTLTLEVGQTILYKFVNGAAWGGLEEVDLQECGVPNGQGGWNRQLTVEPGMGVLPAVCFEGCAPCLQPPTYVQEAFSVDMAFTTEHPNGLYVEWIDPDSAWVPMQYGANGVWTAVVPRQEGATSVYRFRNGGEMESLPSACGGAPPGWRLTTAGTDDGEGGTPCFGSCGPCSEWTGCTYPGAVNFDPGALADDGSCQYAGCTDPMALNYMPNAGMDDGSCTYPSAWCGPGTYLDASGVCVSGTVCAEDINADGQVGVSDILLILGAFGSTCIE